MTSPLSERVTAGPVEQPADTEALTWRPATLADADAVAEIERAMAPVDHPNWVVPAEEVLESLTQPSIELPRDSIVAIDTASGSVVAYGLAVMPRDPERIVRARLNSGGVHPDFRRRGIGRELLGWQVARGLEQLASSDSELPGRLVFSTDERAVRNARLAERFGFVATRWFVEQQRDLSQPIPRIDLDPDIRLVPFTRDRSEATRLAKNDAFRDHWGSEPTSRESWESDLSMSFARDDHSYLALGPNDEVAGLVMSVVLEDDWKLQGFSSGYIALLGVPRAFRGRHIAPALLARAMESYRDAGYERAVLDVDTDNPSGAVALYEGMGFTPTTKTVTYLREF
jgi:mycothiol synthase